MPDLLWLLGLLVRFVVFWIRSLQQFATCTPLEIGFSHGRIFLDWDYLFYLPSLCMARTLPFRFLISTSYFISRIWIRLGFVLWIRFGFDLDKLLLFRFFDGSLLVSSR